jgi:hypothetical protein
VAAVLTTSDFYFEGHRTIYDAMLRIAGRDEPVTPITLLEELRRIEELHNVGGPPHIAMLLEQGAIPAYVPRYARIIRDHGILRELIQAGVDIVTKGFDAQKPPAELLEVFTGRLQGLGDRLMGAEATTVFPVRTLAELLDADIPEPEFHIENWIRTKGVAFIVGDSEAFKSWFAKYLGMCVAAGRALFDQIPVRQAPVLYISEENGEVEDKRRVSLICRGMGIHPAIPFYIASETSFSFDDPARYAALRTFVAEHGIRIIIVDSFIRVHRREEKDAGQMNSLYMDRMKPIIKSGTDLWLLHHRRKLPSGVQGQQQAQVSTDNDDIRGSGDIRAGAHTVLFLKTQSKTNVIVRHNKARGFKKQDPFVFSVQDLDAGGVLLKHEGKPEDALDRSSGCRAAILEFAAEHPTFFRQDVVAALKGKFSKRAIDPMLKALSKDGLPLKEDELAHGRARKKFYTFISSDPDPSEPGDDDVDVPF